ncbi:LysR family transcriptional regulator [Ligilactobacillus sp. WILCCON 0076]|uniref:LysR family transcriptional regulator n=1 Tax=Ligilactobacillus ubinensis TaxID=2876789 RepID=A0A9X2FMV9_9LACO|nr:LysR family transcriptional regulator [Ligilactobacillus ubinensis]MCP0887995.1 LysR family transcriptional regulator [Ligilactobacillus ubinensis]
MNSYLIAFIYVYETQSFSLAAKELFVTQPTISIQIQQLEKMVGQQLFLRKRHQAIMPTVAGKLLYEQALKMRKIWTETQDSLAHITNSKRQLIHIGFSQTISQMLAADFLEKAQVVLPDIDWQVTVDNSDYMAKQLTQKHLDIGLVEKPIPASPSTMRRKKIASDYLVRIGRPTGVWLQREAGSGIAHYTEQFFEEYDIIPEKIIKINRNELILEMVNKGLGETIISQKVVPPNLTYEKLNPHFQRNLYSIVTKELDRDLATKINEILLQVADAMN